MKHVLILLLLDQVHQYALGTTTVSKDKRQVPDPSQLAPCIQAYRTLSTDELRCFTDSYDITLPGLLSPSDFGGICRNEFCMDVMARLLESCKVYRLYMYSLGL